MSDILELENFFMTELHIEWHPSVNSSEANRELSIDYKVFQHQENKQLKRLDLHVNIFETQGKKKSGYSIQSIISGVFSFPESFPEKDVEYLIRVNGGTILYGILRGELASLTGSFPGGKFVLPTVYMHEVVEMVENEHLVKAQKKKTLRKPTKKITRKKTNAKKTTRQKTVPKKKVKKR